MGTKPYPIPFWPRIEASSGRSQPSEGLTESCGRGRGGGGRTVKRREKGCSRIRERGVQSIREWGKRARDKPLCSASALGDEVTGPQREENCRNQQADLGQHENSSRCGHKDGRSCTVASTRDESANQYESPVRLIWLQRGNELLWLLEQQALVVQSPPHSKWVPQKEGSPCGAWHPTHKSRSRSGGSRRGAIHAHRGWILKEDDHLHQRYVGGHPER